MKDIKINDAAYFPRPQAMYKELPINIAMGAEAVMYGTICMTSKPCISGAKNIIRTLCNTLWKCTGR